jgi:hypothetical protein
MDDVEVWRERVRFAEAKYTEASGIAAKIQDKHGEQPPPSDALQQALRDEEQARDEYMRALETLTGLLREP